MFSFHSSLILTLININYIIYNYIYIIYNYNYIITLFNINNFNRLISQHSKNKKSDKLYKFYIFIIWYGERLNFSLGQTGL